MAHYDGWIFESALEKTAAQKIASSDHVSALTIYAGLNDKYKQDWWDWSPETIWQTLHMDLGVEVTDEIKNMVGALQVIVNTNQAFESWNIFENIGHALNENMVYFSVVTPLELTDITWTVKVLQDIRPKEAFQDEILGYIAACAKNSGVVYLPPELFPPKSQMFLDGLNNDMELKAEVERSWPNVVKSDSMVGIQTQKLDEVREYLKND